MAVQIINNMPDIAVHRGDIEPSLSDWTPRATTRSSIRPRPLFMAITLGLHVLAVIGFLSYRHVARKIELPAPIMVTLTEVPAADEEAPPVSPPPMVEMVYTLPTPDLAIETESISVPAVATTAITQATPQAVVPPLVESVEYVRAPSPVYPRESSRRRESGTVVLRVLVDPRGQPAQIQVERSSGYERLDMAARQAVEKALFRPHEVNGIAQAAQVLIPIEFTRRAG